MKHSTTSTPLAVALGAGLIASAGLPAASAQNAEPAKLPAWETTAAAGLSLTRGNSKTLLFNANVLSQKKWDQNEARLGLDGYYGEDNSVKNTEQIQGFAQYNRLFSERAYGYIKFNALHDAVADVEYRFTLSPGAGYYFIKNESTSLGGEVGPGFIYEKQGSEETGYVTLRVAERFEHRFNKNFRVWQSLEWLPQVDNFDNWLLNAEAGIEAALTEKLSLRTFVVDTYDNEPAPGRKKNDLKLVTAIAYKF